MKLWEVLKALEENPEKKFEYNDGSRNYTISTSKSPVDKYFSLNALNQRKEDINHVPAGGFDGNFPINAEWQEVKQSVTWQEAFEAWANGKTIKSFYEGYEAIYQGGKSFLTCKDRMPVDRDEIKFGTWYIEN